MSWGHSAKNCWRDAAFRSVLIAACALMLAACSHNGAANFAAIQTRGASVAFDSIDGPPSAQFETLVRDLNDEAQARRLAVMSRESSSAYRVRGYLAAQVAQSDVTISWVWDVFDNEERRAFRIEGQERIKGSGRSTRDAWAVADDVILRRIAHTSMDRLAAFLTSPDATPNAAPAAAQVAFTVPDDTSPEAAGIFRIFHANADPLPAGAAAAPEGSVDEVPLPRQRPDEVEALAPHEKVTVTAAAL